jgi:ACR3 family arsenite efflux pump ArsB
VVGAPPGFFQRWLTPWVFLAVIVSLLLGAASISVPWVTLFLSVVNIVNRTKKWYEAP